jgi:hypothetical protein
VNRWEAIEPVEQPGAWEGRLQFSDGYAIKTDVCGHWHASSADAERCARKLAARRNAMLMPSDYYLG